MNNLQAQIDRVEGSKKSRNCPDCFSRLRFCGMPVFNLESVHRSREVPFIL